MVKKPIIGMLIYVIAIIFVLAGCFPEDDPVTATPPVFSITPVDISGPFNEQTKTYGSISFAETSPVLTPFGAEIAPHQFSEGIEYYTISETPVLSVCKGIVSTVLENPFEEGDYEIRVTVMPGADYTIVYDHVNQVRIQEALLINPGDTIGVTGNWSDNIRRFSLGITTGENSNKRWYCPLTYGDDDFRNQHLALMQEYVKRVDSPQFDTLCALSVIGP